LIERIEDLDSIGLQRILTQPGMPRALGYPEWHRAAKVLPDAPWLIERILPARALTILTGPAKEAKKSWLAFDLAVAVATGRHIGGLKAVTSGKVLYMYMEDIEKDIAARHEQLAAGEGFTIEELENIHIVHGQAFNLTDKDQARWLQAMVRTHHYNLIVLDTFGRVYFGKENESDEMNKAINIMMSVCYLGCAVMLVHHIKKGHSAHSGGRPMPNEDVRGSSALIGAVSQHLAIRFYAHDPYQMFLAARGKRYDEWYKVTWHGMDPNNPQPVNLDLCSCNEPTVKVNTELKGTY
jgi:RecA-family ATPase